MTVLWRDTVRRDDEKNFVRRSFCFFPPSSPVRRTVRMHINLQTGKLRVEPRPRRAAEESKRIGADHRENGGGPRDSRRGAERAPVRSVGRIFAVSFSESNNRNARDILRDDDNITIIVVRDSNAKYASDSRTSVGNVVGGFFPFLWCYFCRII